MGHPPWVRVQVLPEIPMGYPCRTIILPTQPVPARLTDAQKASREISCQQRKLNAEKLDNDIKAFIEAEQAKITEIVKVQSVTTKKVKDLVGSHTHYHKMCKPALHNVILHAKATEVN